LVRAELSIAVEDDRGSLGGVAILVDVGRDGSHARDTEIKGRDWIAKLLKPWEHEATEACINMKRETFGECKFRESLKIL
jgi:hypothetical protein